jgi:hypothetical protein
MLVACGCVRINQTVSNPLKLGSVPRNAIILQHGYAERRLGVAPGTASDRASIDRLDARTICFAITLHDFAQMDPDGLQAVLKLPGAEFDDATWISPAASNNIVDAVVAGTEATGVEHLCTQTNRVGRCISWQEQPIYEVVWVPGTQTVSQLNTRVCFPNQQRISTETRFVSLSVRIPRVGQEPWMGGHLKSTKFTWGLH